MKHKIKKLSEDLINKIAAGEVVERPASVVKELVENAIDANASVIEINIRDGGKKLIQVIDDGHGIAADELELAVSRHASSKINEFDDLYALKTNGFRGEALASICSVAKVSVASFTGKGDPHEITIDGGVLVDSRVCALPKGTTVTVKYLFHKTPARLKFLKTKETETSHIVNIINKLALSHPEVGFLLRQETNEYLNVPKNQSLKQRVVAVLGTELKDKLYSFNESMGTMEVNGYLGHPQLAKSQRSFAHFFVNGRPVNDKVIWHAVMEAYRDLLMRGKYPVMVLNLKIDEKLVDVNVHPTKAEIRFHKSQMVHQLVLNSLRKKLSQRPWVVEAVKENYTEASFIPQVYEKREQFIAHQEQNISDSLLKWSDAHFESYQEEKQRAYVWPEQKIQTKENIQRLPYSQMNPVGQVLGTFILCEAYDTVYLIDQHAAHERIGFEKLVKAYEDKGLKPGALLVPQTFDLKPSDAEILKHYTGELEKFGFEIEFFGGQTFVIKGVPGELESKIDVEELIYDIVEDVKETGNMPSLKDKLHAILAKIACHAQIRANHHLEKEEMVALLKELDQYQFTDFCPHGRPVCVTIRKDEIEKWFKRIL